MIGLGDPLSGIQCLLFLHTHTVDHSVLLLKGVCVPFILYTFLAPCTLWISMHHHNILTDVLLLLLFQSP